MRKLLVVAVAVAAAAASAGNTGAASRYRGFTAHVDNQWFPLLPGTRYLYTGVKDGKPSRSDHETPWRRTACLFGEGDSSCPQPRLVSVEVVERHSHQAAPGSRRVLHHVDRAAGG